MTRSFRRIASSFGQPCWTTRWSSSWMVKLALETQPPNTGEIASNAIRCLSFLFSDTGVFAPVSELPYRHRNVVSTRWPRRLRLPGKGGTPWRTISRTSTC